MAIFSAIFLPFLKRKQLLYVAFMESITLPKLGLLVMKEFGHKGASSFSYLIVYWWTHPLLFVGQVHLSFKGCQVYFVSFIPFLMENPVSK